MEIDFSETKVNVTLLLSLVSAVLTLFLLCALGRYVLPDRVLSWRAWQILNQRAAYRRQVTLLQEHADRLTILINQEQIDPIHAQLVSEDLVRELNTVTIPPLETACQALLETSQGIVDWSLGNPKGPIVASQQWTNQLIVQVSR